MQEVERRRSNCRDRRATDVAAQPFELPALIGPGRHPGLASENPATWPTESPNGSSPAGSVCSVNTLRPCCGPTAIPLPRQRRFSCMSLVKNASRLESSAGDSPDHSPAPSRRTHAKAIGARTRQKRRLPSRSSGTCGIFAIAAASRHLPGRRGSRRKKLDMGSVANIWVNR